ncbi:zinc finger HIT domain-containing protein 1 [Entomortierella parvispora]|uniref:Zinc finger HIT domain-containing protein 1 n=1 Tax=Entomortierella parvispora TaxID=205924 RepID=A0A9P3H9U5_9FUNG|nr:zinc finger HIT domain-containing protein 1 [Entomortierella parvispora]
MSRKPDRNAKAAAPKVLDQEARNRQIKHHLDSLERDNFVALNEFEAIIATAAAAASAPGPVSLTHTNLGPHGLLPPLNPDVGSIVGGVLGTVGPGSALNGPTKTSGTLSGSRTKKGQLNGPGSNGPIHSISAAGGGSAGPGYGHKKPILQRKPLNQLLDESGQLNVHFQRQEEPLNYVTASMGPSRYPDRQFCSVCGWKGKYRCGRCGMRYCDLRCLKTHEDTRCMKFTI